MCQICCTAITPNKDLVVMVSVADVSSVLCVLVPLDTWHNSFCCTAAHRQGTPAWGVA